MAGVSVSTRSYTQTVIARNTGKRAQADIAMEKERKELETMPSKAWKAMGPVRREEFQRRRRELTLQDQERGPKRGKGRGDAAETEKAETTGTANTAQELAQPKWKAPPLAPPQELLTAAPAPAPEHCEAVEPEPAAQRARSAQMAAPQRTDWVVVEIDDQEAPAGAQLVWKRTVELTGQRTWGDYFTAQRALQQRAVDRAFAKKGNVVLE